MGDSAVTGHQHVVRAPDEFRDRGADWYAYWDGEQRREIRGILRDHPEIVEEHERNPTGYRAFHSPLLQRVLNYMRTQPIFDKYFVYTSTAWDDYRIGLIAERGQPPEILDEPVFGSEEEAMHGVFIRRAEELLANDD